MPRNAAYLLKGTWLVPCPSCTSNNQLHVFHATSWSQSLCCTHMCCTGCSRLHAQLDLLIIAKPKVACLGIEALENDGIKNAVAAEVAVLKIQACTAPQTSYECGARQLARGHFNTRECCTFVDPVYDCPLQDWVCRLGLSFILYSHRQGKCAQALYITTDGSIWITWLKLITCVLL